ncbi:MAG: hypothetical protein V2B18_10855 [Pseudomonadota bacterium]
MIPLSEFLAAAVGPLRLIAQWHRYLIEAKSGVGTRGSGVVDSLLTEADFLRTFQLNPELKLHYIRTLRPDEVDSNAPHDPSRGGPPGRSYVSASPGECLQPTEILAAHADEPDWGMDQDLFHIKGYGYGPCPYGPDYGAGSQAPFHMAFLKGSSLLVRLRPLLTRNFMGERIRLFFVLARLAFDVRALYWGWRFTSWAMHYLQDLTQPYHAVPIPFPLVPAFLKAVVRGGTRRFVEQNRNLLRNRHCLFEAAVHYILNDAVKRLNNHPFPYSLEGEGDACIGTIRSVTTEFGSAAARSAGSTDRAMMGLDLQSRITDPNYSLEEDDVFRIDEAVARSSRERPTQYRRFLDVVAASLRLTGRVTRFAVRRIEDSVPV